MGKKIHEDKSERGSKGEKRKREKGRGKGGGREGKGHQHLFFLNLTEKDDFFGKMILDKIFEK